MDTLEFIFKRMTDKFIEDTETELWRYKRFLEKVIKKPGRNPKAVKALKAVRKALGEPETEVTEKTIESDSYDKRQQKRKKVFEKIAKESINFHFSD